MRRMIKTGGLFCVCRIRLKYRQEHVIDGGGGMTELWDAEPHRDQEINMVAEMGGFSPGRLIAALNRPISVFVHTAYRNNSAVCSPSVGGGRRMPVAS